jgi:multidrug resistance efflux pump
MRIFTWLATAALLGAVSSCRPAAAPQQALAAEPQPAGSAPADDIGEIIGRTQPAPGRSGTIAPVVLHPVVEVLVKPGDRVKKDQPLVKLDDDEPRADVRAKEAGLKEMRASLARLKAEPREAERAEARALLESVKINAKHAREILGRLEPAWRKGAIPEQRYHEARVSILRLAAEERAAIARLERLLKRPVELEIAELEAKIAAAQAGLDTAKAELEHYTPVSPIDGVISRLEVNPGTVSRPGTSVWGEVLDLRELDVLCELTAAQAERVSVGQEAEVIPPGRKNGRLSGRVAWLGIAADRRTGRVPVRVRVKNPRGHLRCYVPVTVHFGARPLTSLGK